MILFLRLVFSASVVVLCITYVTYVNGKYIDHFKTKYFLDLTLLISAIIFSQLHLIILDQFLSKFTIV